MDLTLLRSFRLCALKLLKWIVGVGADISLEGVGFLAYRLERASEADSLASLFLFVRIPLS